MCTRFSLRGFLTIGLVTVFALSPQVWNKSESAVSGFAAAMERANAESSGIGGRGEQKRDSFPMQSPTGQRLSVETVNNQ